MDATAAARREAERIHHAAVVDVVVPLKEEARTYPRCPSFFICGDLPVGAITIKKV